MNLAHRYLSLTGLTLTMALGLNFAPALAQNMAPDPALVSQGEYLAKAADCTSCHTNPAPASAPFAGGSRMATPVGTFITPNITPSKTAGIGLYSLAEFSRVVRQGVTRQGAHLFPVMPYDSYSAISDADMAALYSYFMLGVAPVDHLPERTVLPFPYDFRQAMIGWNLIYARDQPFTDTSSPGTRGRYLVEVLGHCSTCHSPRNFLLAEEASRHLGGAMVGNWQAPNITSDPVSGIGGWSQQELVSYFKTGHVPGKAVAADGMAAVISNSLQYMSDSDLTAMADYLKLVPAIADPTQKQTPYSWTTPRPLAITSYEIETSPAQTDLVDTSTNNGALLYNSACASCHGLNGSGTSDHFYPALTGSSTVGAANPANLVMTIMRGINRETGTRHVFMPSFGGVFNDAQIASLATYVTSSFGDPAVKVSAAQIKQITAGDEQPPLIKAMPYLMALSLVILLLVFMLIFKWVMKRVNRRKSSS